MRRIINYHPSRGGAIVAGTIPIALMLAAYFAASAERLAANPRDKLMPGLSQMWDAAVLMGAKVDLATGQILLWSDTVVSFGRLLASMSVATTIGLVLGVLVGFIPHLRAAFSPILAILSLIPPLAILPILFIVFGLGEVSKVVLIVIGIAPFLVRDVALQVTQIPREQIVKAQTLGASTWHMIVHVVVPQVMPRLLDSLRLSLGAGWLFLISAEAIASDSGLGYRLFLVRRYMAMDIILTYVAWITLLAFITDYGLKRLGAYYYPWANQNQT
ncbi:ABC transporter permease [Chthonobacter rhizosphaerae]|uniref:ABC transporter permease n=1 Tax=Chthonobacter rhizosphaerae TaxID=2735553 RepID=UPI0015EF4C97|nr:ABC transporter permease subunit [Chthonobacter rhizosphaerae]